MDAGNRFKDLTGLQFGRLTVLSVKSKNKWGNYHWLCRCGCGTEKSIPSKNLINGSSTSCGCLAIDRLIKRRMTHGHTKGGTITKEYNAWSSMRKRCSEKSGDKDYAGRGIKVCKRWSKFKNFLIDMGPSPSPDHSVGRVNNDGNYEPSNCRWETAVDQQNNKRNSKIVTIDGRSMTMAQWSKMFGLNIKTVHNRLTMGWEIKTALITPVLVYWNRRLVSERRQPIQVPLS